MPESAVVTDLLHQLAEGCRILEMEGHGDMTLGHLSVRDPESRGFWLKRNRAGLGEIVGPEDFVLLDLEGNQLAGDGGRHSEWPIHAEILKKRPDIAVVAHTHPIHACVISGSTDPLLPVTVDADYFVDLPRHAETSALINTPALGADLADALGENVAVFMANHGVTFCGTSVAHAICVGVFLEKACRAHLLAAGMQARWNLPSAEDRHRRHSQIMTPAHIEHSWNYFRRKLAASHGAGVPIFGA
ncbi:MAG: class II aldolase/adducin family protein [Azospirillaceae bacterium]